MKVQRRNALKQTEKLKAEILTKATVDYETKLRIGDLPGGFRWTVVDGKSHLPFQRTVADSGHPSFSESSRWTFGGRWWTANLTCLFGERWRTVVFILSSRQGRHSIAFFTLFLFGGRFKKQTGFCTRGKRRRRPHYTSNRR